MNEAVEEIVICGILLLYTAICIAAGVGLGYMLIG